MKAYVFPGQGAQFPGMGKDLYETNPLVRDMFDKAKEILGFDIVDVIDPEDAEGWRGELKAIIVDVEWGPSEHRRRLSDTRHAVQVWRGNMGRTP